MHQLVFTTPITYNFRPWEHSSSNDRKADKNSEHQTQKYVKALNKKTTPTVAVIWWASVRNYVLLQYCFSNPHEMGFPSAPWITTAWPLFLFS